MSSRLPPAPPLAPGFRFHPTDEELVGYYLRRKIAGLPIRSGAIAEVEFHRWEPWDLPKFSGLGWPRSRDRQWFFFYTIDRKYHCSQRANRATAGGFWKATGRERPVFLAEDHKSRTIGMRKSLVFHTGRAPNGRRTDWVMHEFRLEEDDRNYNGTRGTSFVVCRVYKKNVIGHKNADERLAPLMEEDQRDEEEQDLVPIAEQEDGDANDFEQGTTEAMHNTDLSTIGCEASSLNLNPPSNDLLAPGFRFHPTDEELVSYYLKRKVSGLPLRVDAIGEIDLYKWDPWELPPRSRLSLSMLSTEWFFFCTVDRKYNYNTHQNNRATTKGFWKSTGIDRIVRHRTSEKIIGMKKTLVFHTGRAPDGQRTNWVMHEYRLQDNEQNAKGSSFVVCRIFHKSGAGPRKPLALYGSSSFVEELQETSQDLGPARKYFPAPDLTVDTVPTVVTLDAGDKNCECTFKNSEQVTTSKLYDNGSKVEIAYIRDKLPVAWYMATVIKVIDDKVLLVEYESLKSEDDTLVSEIVSTQYIRPQPPSTAGARNFQLLDEVEAFCNGGWWPGVVAKVIAASRYNVKFMHWEDEIELDRTELRLLYDWVDGRWVQAAQDKPIESQNLGGSKSIDHLQSLHECNISSNCGFLDLFTPPSGSGDETPSMNHENENLDRSNFQSEQENFQSCKRAKKGEASKDNTKSLLVIRGNENSSAVKTGFDIRTPILEEESNIRIKALVEKCCSTSPFKKDDAVSADSITVSGEINEDPPVPDKSSQELVSVHTPLSTNVEEYTEGISGKNEFLQTGQESGAWLQIVDTQQEKEVVPELDHEGEKGSRQYTAGDERRIPLEGFSMGNQRGNKESEPLTERLSSAQCVVCSDSDVQAQEAFNVTSSSDTSLVETSTSNAQPSEAQDINFLSTEGEHSPKSGPAEKSPSSEQSPLPFEKCSSMWDSFESMEAFGMMPQRPHFRPLEKLCKDFREGMAIGLMVTFSNLVHNIDKLVISDSFHKFDGILKTVDNLERYGFDVQCIRSRLLELIRLKNNQDQLADEGSTLKILLSKEQKKKEQLNKQIESFNNVSEELEKSLTRLREERSNILKRKRENESGLDRLEMDSRRIAGALLSARHDFEATRCVLS